MNKNKFFVWCLIKRHLGKNSIKHTRIRYDFLCRWLGQRKLTADATEKFILYLRERGLRNSSINSYIRVINLIDIYERENNKDLNLLRKICYFPKQKRTPAILSQEEIEKLLSVDLHYAPRNLSIGLNINLNLTYKLILYVIASTGCRIEEALSLKKEHLQFGINTGWVLFKDTKNLWDRKVPLPPIVIEPLKNFVLLKKPADYIFLSTRGHKIATQSFEEDLKKRAEAAKLQYHIYPHCFRNSYIREQRRSGTDILSLAKLVGHRDPKTTFGYDLFDEDDLLKAAQNHFFFLNLFLRLKWYLIQKNL